MELSKNALRNKRKRFKKLICNSEDKNFQFNKWLKSKHSLLTKIDESAKLQKKPCTITCAGMLFLLYRLPIEIQKNIVRFLIEDIKPSILGIHAEDLSQPHVIFTHEHLPFIDKHHFFLRCDRNPCCELPYPMAEIPDGFCDRSKNHLINCVVKAVQQKMPHSSIHMLNPKKQVIISTSGKTVCTWEIERSKNRTLFTNVNAAKNDLNLYRGLLLLDQHNMYTRCNQIPLSKKCINYLQELKDQITEVTQTEPIFVTTDLYTE